MCAGIGRVLNANILKYLGLIILTRIIVTYQKFLRIKSLLKNESDSLTRIARSTLI